MVTLGAAPFVLFEMVRNEFESQQLEATRSDLWTLHRRLCLRRVFRAQALYQLAPARVTWHLLWWTSAVQAWIAAQSESSMWSERNTLVSIALQGLREPYSILSFSGEGPRGVQLRSVKAFDEEFGPAVARRIAMLEPQHYTRAGAAIRHATSMLMRQTARHRLLLVLSDGKPNDIDA